MLHLAGGRFFVYNIIWSYPEFGPRAYIIPVWLAGRQDCLALIIIVLVMICGLMGLV